MNNNNEQKKGNNMVLTTKGSFTAQMKLLWRFSVLAWNAGLFMTVKWRKENGIISQIVTYRGSDKRLKQIADIFMAQAEKDKNAVISEA